MTRPRGLVTIGGARHGRIRVKEEDLSVLLPEWILREQAERFASSGAILARRGGLLAHEEVGYLLREEP